MLPVLPAAPPAALAVGAESGSPIMPRVTGIRPSRIAGTKTSTISAANWVPAFSVSWLIAFSTVSPARYGRSVVIASNASATFTILAPTEI